MAVNERIDEAMNYRKELKAFEVQEAERVEGLKQKNAENQRKKLLADQVSSRSYNLSFIVVKFYWYRKRRWSRWRRKSRQLGTT